MTEKREVGHQFLARLGKKRLRPGGIVATNWLLSHVVFTQKTQVLEVACNMCTTAIELAQQYRCQITGIDIDRHALDKARHNIQASKLEKYIHVQEGNAFKLPFPDNTFDVVINEAMLTMLSNTAKQKALKEYLRVLKPGGKLLTHDITYHSNQTETLIHDLSDTIHIHVSPLANQAWQDLFTEVGFTKVVAQEGPMSLMRLSGMLKDEGLLNTLKIMRNGLRKENRHTFLRMRSFFSKAKNDLAYIAICSTK